MRATWVSGFLLLPAVLTLFFGCDEEKKPTPTKAAASVVASTLPAPSAPSNPPKEESKRAPRPKRSAADCPKVTTVTFPSADFEAAVRLKLQKKDGPISLADLGKLRSLNISQSKLSDLDICLFPQLKELHELFIGPGEVDDRPALRR